MTDATNLDQVRKLLSEKKGELMEKYSARGVAIGKDDASASRYVLVVYLEKPRNSPMEPLQLDGVPIRFKVTGRFNPQT